MDPQTPQRPQSTQAEDGHLADLAGTPLRNGKVGQQGDKPAGSRVDVDAAAQAPTAPLVEARRGGRYSPNRSTGLRAHSHYTPNELEERAKNAWYWTQLEADGFNTKFELVIAGMMLMCELLEEHYNGGQLFPPAPEQTRRGPSPAGTARHSQAMRAYWNQRRTPDGQPARTPDPASPASADPPPSTARSRSSAVGTAAEVSARRRCGGLSPEVEEQLPGPPYRCDTNGSM